MSLKELLQTANASIVPKDVVSEGLAEYQRTIQERDYYHDLFKRWENYGQQMQSENENLQRRNAGLERQLGRYMRYCTELKTTLSSVAQLIVTSTKKAEQIATQDTLRTTPKGKPTDLDQRVSVEDDGEAIPKFLARGPAHDQFLSQMAADLGLDMKGNV